MAKEEEMTTTEAETEVSERQEMKPWEQHGGVISIPRFNYNAPSSLLQHSHSGFLITCAIKRVKSATKEAMSILGKFIGSFTSCTKEGSDNSDENFTSKRRKTCTEDSDGEHAKGDESKDVANKSEDQRESPLLALSILYQTFFGLWNLQVVSPHPIHATCTLNEKELLKVVSTLVLEFVNDKQNKIAQPLKFAVGCNRRGNEENEMKLAKDASIASNLLDRSSCFSTVAAAVKDIVPDSVVDLKSPELSVLVELPPLSGVPNGSLVVAVSVLPQNLVSTKPQLFVKALVSNVKAKCRNH